MTAVTEAPALTAAEITDARLDVISHAREVLERACSEHSAWRGRTFRVTGVMASLEAAIRSWENAGSGDERDEALRMAAWWSVRVVQVVEDVMGPEAAAYVSGGEGEWAA